MDIEGVLLICVYCLYHCSIYYLPQRSQGNAFINKWLISLEWNCKLVWNQTKKKGVDSQKEKHWENLCGSFDTNKNISPITLRRLELKIWWGTFRDLLNKLEASFIFYNLEIIILHSCASSIHFQSVEWLICYCFTPNEIVSVGYVFPSSKHSFRHIWNEAPIPEESERTPISTVDYKENNWPK